MTDSAPRLACPICGGDVCEHRIEAWERNTAILQAMWDVAWHTGRPVTLRVAGTHVNYDVIETGEYEFTGTEGEDRLIEWGTALRHREANAPLPTPRAEGT